MSGSHSLLCEYSSMSVLRNRRDNYQLVADAVLGSQFVASDLLPGFAYRVKIGAGMEMLPSGDIANACFYNLVEKDFVLLTSTRRNHGFLFYACYKDDILLIFNCPNGVMGISEFLKEMWRSA